ncbi:MAG TPA: FdtA/QdtA family cupin domain-containing protein [Vitreimonas sp.]|uniref:sugar 3,4-ketoisomerase n=1 Tax=Vitreimonas sp. TaxID=3069702 RepID=UPI002D50B6F0|nr:FdtA/QdtA family cupin domain-containing protein [Vitreimonas sp.]HYD87791.1 FdtA/QdtA family cupin domain-containing protein [Vitreimonas sp.]
MPCTASFYGGLVKTFRFGAVADARGSLTPFDFADLGFTPVRAFLVDAPDGATRGGHAHRSGRQLLIRVGGEISVETAHQSENHTFNLTETENALLIAAPVWARQLYRGADARLLALCDTPYDPASYVAER